MGLDLQEVIQTWEKDTTFDKGKGKKTKSVITKMEVYTP